MVSFERYGNEGFWKAHDALFAGQRDMSNIPSDGQDGVPIPPEDERADRKVSADMALAKALGAAGTRHASSTACS